MEYGTDFIWKQLSFSVKFKHNTHSTIKLACPDYQSRWSSNFFKPISFLDYLIFGPMYLHYKPLAARQNSLHSNLNLRFHQNIKRKKIVYTMDKWWKQTWIVVINLITEMIIFKAWNVFYVVTPDAGVGVCSLSQQPHKTMLWYTGTLHWVQIRYILHRQLHNYTCSL